ncbi:MAG TPA: hypothetical protein VFK47_04655, partial [Ktedonobacteraceae bacterium]|nr:hypothetical protein [Ktedonobacteraceae bacterium]
MRPVYHVRSIRYPQQQAPTCFKHVVNSTYSQLDKGPCSLPSQGYAFLAAAIAQSLYFVIPKTPPRCTDHPRRPGIPNPTNAPP